jgi:hypothetical protein
LAKAIKTQLIKENLNNSLKKNIKPQAQPAFALVPESTILIGYCQSKQRQWVEKKGLYNIRLRPLHK